MLTILWNRAMHSRPSSPSPTTPMRATPAPPVPSVPSVTPTIPTPFTEFVISRVPDEEFSRLFAITFGECLRRDPDALEIDFDTVHKWLGIEKEGAVRLLKGMISEDEHGSYSVAKGSGVSISFNQFEELMTAAQTSEGKKARKLVGDDWGKAPIYSPGWTATNVASKVLA